MADANEPVVRTRKGRAAHRSDMQEEIQIDWVFDMGFRDGAAVNTIREPESRTQSNSNEHRNGAGRILEEAPRSRDRRHIKLLLRTSQTRPQIVLLAGRPYPFTATCPP